MEKFYKIRFAQKKSEVFFEFLSVFNEQDLKIGKYIPDGPLKAKISEGKKFYDIVRFQDPYNFAISLKVFNLLKSNNITGWDTFEIEVKNIENQYYGFQVIGKCGELKRPKEIGFVQGFEFDYSTWDKSDLFSPAGTLAVFCTQKVKDIFEHSKVTNVELKDIETIEWYNA